MDASERRFDARSTSRGRSAGACEQGRVRVAHVRLRHHASGEIQPRSGHDRANGELDKVYKQLMAKLDEQQQKSLKEAQRAWIKWRDAEADIMARVGGAVGGSAMRVDYANAQGKLIKERLEVLRGFLEEVESNR